MQISVMLNNFRQPVEAALETAAGLEIPAVQVTVASEDNAAARARMAQSVRASGLAVSATSVDFGDWGDPDSVEKNIELAKPLLDATPEFGTDICQTHVGIMPYNTAGPRWNAFVRCGETLAAYADSIGVCIALETGPEPARVMETLMRTIDSPGLRVNYDPANFIIWPAVLPASPDLMEHTGQEPQPYDREAALELFEPVEGIKRLGSYIVHTHAKDAIGDGGWADVPLGTGWVDWQRYLCLLQEAGYDGYLGIEREGGDDRIGEIGHAARFLREQLGLLKSGS